MAHDRKLVAGLTPVKPSKRCKNLQGQNIFPYLSVLPDRQTDRCSAHSLRGRDMTEAILQGPDATPPRVFVSYSHDSPLHKEWVAGLCGRLRGKGIDVILDQWDTSLGCDLGHFMEHGLTTADRVLVICTPTYCKKANDGQGGVGYEKIIVTQDLIRNTHTNKFIPVIRVGDVDPRDVVPICLGARLFIDLRDDDESAIDELVRDIHRQPAATKPPIGKSPFAQTATGAAVFAVATGPLPSTEVANLDATTIYDQAIQLARAKDFIAWRHLARNVRTKSLKALTDCRSQLDELISSGSISQNPQIAKLLDLGMVAVAPMIAMALAGVESGLSEIERQEAVLDEIVNVAGWNRAGYTILGDFPINLGFMYHFLHGAMAMQVGRLDLAMDFARSSFQPQNYRERTKVCEHHGLSGWTPAFQSHVTHSWRYLQAYVKRESWVRHCFGSAPEVLSAIAAYGYALTVNELADVIRRTLSSDGAWKPDPESFLDIKPDIPLFFLVDDEPSPERGFQLFLRCRRDIPKIFEHHGVPAHLLPIAWESWVRGSIAWLGQVSFHHILLDSASSLPHAMLMVELGISKKRPFQENDR
jgi:hypothetical protein